MVSAGGEGATARGRQRVLLMLAPNPEISGPVPGPIARLAYLLVDALDAVGYRVDTELWGRHKREETLLRKVAGRAADLVRIRRRIARGSYDLVFIHTTHDWVALVRDLLLVIPSSRRVRWVFLVHGSRFRPGRRLFERATGLLAGRASAILLLSSEEVSAWRGLYPRGRFYQVANAYVPLSREASAAPGASRKEGAELLFAGRLIAEKGAYDVLEAVALVRRERDVRLTVAGEGPETEGLRARAADLGIADAVELTGHLGEGDMARVYEQADVFVFPTYFLEGMPTVLLEAMSFGLPIVTTRIRGAADYLRDGENALFVPPRTPEAVADAIRRLLDDEALRLKMRESNLRRVRDFYPSSVVAGYERAFDEVLGGAAEGPA